MTDYILVPTLDNIRFSSKWRDCEKFHAEGRFLNKEGQYVKESHAGRRYVIALKKERKYSTGERVARVICGLFLSLITLGLANIDKHARRLFTADRKILRFAVEVKPSKPKQEEGAIKGLQVVRVPIEREIDGDIHAIN
jgi:hypothetical protein